MKYLITIPILAVIGSSSMSAERVAMMECSYAYPDETSRFVETEVKAFEWLGRMAEDKTSHAKDVQCVPLNNETPNYHLFTQTRNGQVSIQHGLTHQQCEYILYTLSDHSECRNPNGCMRMLSPSDLQKGECFK